MLTIVCFKWKPKDYWTGISRCEFTSEHVNTLLNMVNRHYHKPFRFVCVTDDPLGLDRGVEYHPLWDDLADVETAMDGWVSCYPRLKIFSKEMAEVFGPRILVLDIDTVIVDDVTELWDRPEPFVGIRLHPWSEIDGPLNDSYGGAMYLMDAGAFPEVWDDFDVLNSPQESKHHGFRGSDQAWISYKLGPGHPVWIVADGVVSSRQDALLVRHRTRPGTRIVMFHGRHRPWGKRAQGCSWVRKNYR